MLPWGERIGIDLGTSHTQVCIPGEGVVVREPTVVAYVEGRRRPAAVGEEARKLEERGIRGLRIARPVRGGVVADFDAAMDLLRACLRAAIGRRPLLAPTAVCASTTEATEVERRALHDCLRHAGVGRPYLVPKSLAAGLGTEEPADDDTSRLIVDIGAGTTDVGVLSMGAVADTLSLHYGGDDLDEAIMRWIYRTKSVQVSPRAAEEVKLRVGAVDAGLAREGGRLNGVGDQPPDLGLSARDIPPVLLAAVMPIIGELRWLLDTLPPERRAQLSTTGMTLTGGTSLLRGLPALFESRLDIPVRAARDPLSCTILGIEYITANLENLSLNGRRYARMTG